MLEGIKSVLTVLTIVYAVIFALFWLVGFTVVFHRVDYPSAKTHWIVVGNMIQSIFSVIMPLVIIYNIFDSEKPPLERKASQNFIITLLVLIGLIILLQIIAIF